MADREGAIRVGRSQVAAAVIPVRPQAAITQEADALMPPRLAVTITAGDEVM